MDKREEPTSALAEDHSTGSEKAESSDQTLSLHNSHIQTKATEKSVEPGDVFIDDPESVERYRLSVIRSRMSDLGLAEKEAREWTDDNLKEHRSIAGGAFVNEQLRPVAHEHTLEGTPLSSDEKSYWDRRVKFRTEILGLPLVEAEDWTRHEIERTRELFADQAEGKRSEGSAKDISGDLIEESGAAAV